MEKGLPSLVEKRFFLPLNKAKKFYLHAVKENNQSSIVEEV